MISCKKCGADIPRRVYTEKGWKAISNRRVYCFDCSPKGLHNTRKLHEPSARSLTCKRCGAVSKRRSLCPSCQVTLWRQRMKLKAIAYKGGRCISCGFDKYACAMEFHHLDSTQKDFSISGLTIAWARMQVELDKCVLLCANCHRAVHNEEIIL